MNTIEDKKIEEFRIYSDPVEEVLTTPPSALLSSGNYIIAAGVTILLLAAYFIKFPDVVTANGIVTTIEAPIKLNAQSAGNLSYLLTQGGNEQYVEKGSMLAVVTISEDYDSIMSLKTELDKINHTGPLKTRVNSLPIAGVGSMSEEVASLKSSIRQFQTFMLKLTVDDEVNQYRQQLITNNEVLTTLNQEKEFAKIQLQLTEKNLGRQQKLAKDGIVAEMEVEKIMQELSDRQSAVINVERRIQENISLAQSLERQIFGLLSTDQRYSAEVKFSIDQTVDRLLSKIEIWKARHIVMAPMSGICTPIEVLQKNQYIDEDQKLFYISPASADYHIEGTLPFEKSGLVSIGQDVIVKLTQFPYREYGTIMGEIDYISYTPGQNGYYFTASLKTGNKTSYDIDLGFKPLMPASLEVILEDSNLLERVFYEIKNIFS